MNTFPPINIKTTNFDQTPAIERVLEKSLGTLDKFLPDGETALTCEVELEQQLNQQTGKIFRAEVNLQIGGKLFRAEATEERMEDAIERAKNELKAELSRVKGKRQSMLRRGAQRIKDMMRFGSE